MAFLQGKKALVVGVASKRSIAYGIAEAMYQQGAEIALTYQGDKIADRVKQIGDKWGSELILPCDLANDDDIAGVFDAIRKHWGEIDIIVHSAAFAPADELDGDYLDCVTREGFKTAHDISSYSFAALAKQARPLLNEGGSLLTMTYQGSERAVPNYNVMGVAKASLEANVRYMAQSLGPQGVRVNAISAGPIRTLAASGIKGFKKMLTENEKVVPLRQNVTIGQVGNTAAFLCSELAGGITGEIVHVDAGFHAVGMADTE